MAEITCDGDFKQGVSGFWIYKRN